MIINLVVLHSGSSWTEGTWRPSRPKGLICEYLFLKGSRCTHSPFSCAVVHYIDVSLSLQGEKGNSGPPGQKGPKGSEGNQGNRGPRGGKGPPGKQVMTFFHSLVSKWPLVTCVGADNVFAPSLKIAINHMVQGHRGAVGSRGIPGVAGQKVCQRKKQFQAINYICKSKSARWMYINPAGNTFHRVNQVLVVHQVHLDCLDWVATQEWKGPKVRRGSWDRQ